LNLLEQKLAAEMHRLAMSGTTDPVTQARINAFGQIRQKVNQMSIDLQKGILKPRDVPIRMGDFNKFLPAIGNRNAGITGLLSKSGHNDMPSLLRAYQQGNITNADMTTHLFNTYAQALLRGLSYSIDLKYTSQNEVAVRQAEAAIALSNNRGRKEGFESNPWSSTLLESSHPMTLQGSRNSFDSYRRKLDIEAFQGTVGTAIPKETTGMNWEYRTRNIYNNIQNFGLNPEDFGCKDFPEANTIQSDFSWRGYAKMICTRLATHIDPGIPVQIGCPPVSWQGWNS
jgi:hypothetical protein